MKSKTLGDLMEELRDVVAINPSLEFGEQLKSEEEDAAWGRMLGAGYLQTLGTKQYFRPTGPTWNLPNDYIEFLKTYDSISVIAFNGEVVFALQSPIHVAWQSIELLDALSDHRPSQWAEHGEKYGFDHVVFFSATHRIGWAFDTRVCLDGEFAIRKVVDFSNDKGVEMSKYWPENKQIGVDATRFLDWLEMQITVVADWTPREVSELVYCEFDFDPQGRSFKLVGTFSSMSESDVKHAVHDVAGKWIANDALPKVLIVGSTNLEDQAGFIQNVREKIHDGKKILVINEAAFLKLHQKWR